MSSNITYGPTVPDGYAPPFAIVTPEDHEAWILIATALGLVCLLFFAGIRILVRYTISRGFGWDDHTVLAATGLAVIQSSLIFGACTKGFGKSLNLVPEINYAEVQSLWYAAELLFIVALGLAKISVVFFLLRISRVKEHRLAFYVAIGLMAAWTVASFFAIALQCDLTQPWVNIGENCAGMHKRYLGICIVDIISELAIVGLVMYLIYTLKTSVSSKIMVVSIFSVRLLIIVAIVFRITSFDEAGYMTNPFLTEASFIAWTQAELAYSLISATVPTFQNFLKTLNTGFGGIGAAEHRYGYGYGYAYGSQTGGKKDDGYQMSNLHSAVRDEEPKEIGLATTRDNEHGLHQHSTTQTTTSGDRANSLIAADATSIGSNGSERFMIRKNVQWTVRTEQR